MKRDKLKIKCHHLEKKNKKLRNIQYDNLRL